MKMETISIARSIEYSSGDKRPFQETCPVCGKKFTVYNADLWAYKRSKRASESSKSHHRVPIYFCSWHCINDFDSQSKEEKTITCQMCGKKMKIRSTRGKQRLYCYECARQRNVDRQRQYYWQRKKAVKVDAGK